MRSVFGLARIGTYWHVLAHPEKNIICIVASTGSILSSVEHDINRWWSWKIESGWTIRSAQNLGHKNIQTQKRWWPRSDWTYLWDCENIIPMKQIDNFLFRSLISEHSKDVSKPFPGWNTLMHGPKLFPVEFPAEITNVIRYSHFIADQSLEIAAIANFAIWCSEHTTMNCNRSNQFRLSLGIRQKESATTNSSLSSNNLSIHGVLGSQRNAIGAMIFSGGDGCFRKDFQSIGWSTRIKFIWNHDQSISRCTIKTLNDSEPKWLEYSLHQGPVGMAENTWSLWYCWSASQHWINEWLLWIVHFFRFIGAWNVWFPRWNMRIASDWQNHLHWATNRKWKATPNVVYHFSEQRISR
jgi:hypothetical protein